MEKTVIALGFFDGVHRGHGALLRKTAERARELGAVPAAFTFDRPPKEVVTGQPVYLINSNRDRQGLMERLYGIERVIFAPFDREMMTMPWEAYLEMLIGTYGAVHFVAGHDHRFGHKNAGNVQLLRQKCAEMGIGCDIIPPVQREGITVSSTYIRTLVEAGDMERAADFLGHRHCLSQTVQQDKDLEKLAKANHISTGKAALIRQAMALNSSLTFEGLAKLSVEELRDLIEAGAPGMPIGMTAALEAAANYAGLTTADVADADVDPELDETPAHYEVELEVPGHGELEYRVDAYTGQVLSGPANVKLSAPVNQSGDIGMEAAKSAALKHAGLSSATFTKAERDYDRWEYELEFHTDTAAYEVTVDAISGSVLDYEKENPRSSSTSDIGAQAAKSAALRHAGLSEGQVQELQVEWDNENGRAVYEVEFKSGGMEYEYVIDAATGSVLEHQAEQDD